MILMIQKGNLVELALRGRFNAIVHGCNCFCQMGAGIAKTIKQTWPEAYKADQKTIIGDKNKLGTYSFYKSPFCIIINAYTQYNYGRKKINVNYPAIEKVFTLINKDFAGKTVGIPKIGAGLAGGDWDKIETIINKVTPNLNIILIEYVR